MFGPLTSNASLYVAECGRAFSGYAEGRAHERTCPHCQADTVNTLATLDHRGPLTGYCFMGLNFTPEQFGKINVAIVDHMGDKSLEFGVEEAIVELITASGPQPPKLDPVEPPIVQKVSGPSREWLLKMADAEDAAGSVSVGGLMAAWECVHCGSDILPGGTCGHCGINDGDEKFKSELSHMMVRLILCLPMDHHLRDEATQWLLKRGLIVEGVAEAMKL